MLNGEGCSAIDPLTLALSHQGRGNMRYFPFHLFLIPLLPLHNISEKTLTRKRKSRTLTPLPPRHHAPRSSCILCSPRCSLHSRRGLPIRWFIVCIVLVRIIRRHDHVIGSQSLVGDIYDIGSVCVVAALLCKFQDDLLVLVLVFVLVFIFIHDVVRVFRSKDVLQGSCCKSLISSCRRRLPPRRGSEV